MLPKLLIAAILLLVAPAAVRAETQPVSAYEALTAVSLAPNQAPNFVNGVDFLSQDEHRHHEHLPLQLDGAMKKVNKAKYHPSGLSRDVTVDF